MAFFNNPQNLRGDQRIVVNRHEGNQYNNYDARGNRHSPYPAPADGAHARGPRRPQQRPHNHRQNPDPNQHFGRGAHGIDIRGATIDIVGGRIFNNYEAPPNEPEPEPRDIQTDVDTGGDDIEMNETNVQPESPAASVHDQLPAFANTYVAVRLNADATLQSLGQTKELIAIVKNMTETIKYFVGYIEHIGHDSEFRLHLLRPAPLDSPMEHLTPQMSIPVLPTLAADRKSSRKPLCPNRKLPWANCFHAPSDHLVVRILPDGVESNSKVIKTSLPPSEVTRHSTCLSQDYIRRNNHAKRRMNEVRIAKQELNDLLSGNTSTNATLNDAALERAEINVDRARKSSRTLREALSTQIYTLQTAMMTVTISYDLSLVKDLPDPQELLKQHIYLADTIKIQRANKETV